MAHVGASGRAKTRRAKALILAQLVQGIAIIRATIEIKAQSKGVALGDQPGPLATWKYRRLEL
jgi:hypothetical protein